MSRPTARVLALLEVLQSGGTRTVSDLAVRLAVDERTVRRYVEHLRDLDVPVRTVRGRYGGYRLAPGFRMPPLMLTDEEALALLLGLLAGTRTGLVASTAAASDSAAAKLRRVLPEALARRCDAVLKTTDVTAPDRTVTPPEARVLMLLADAARERYPVAITYTDRHGRARERTIHPYGIVAHSARWYVTGADSASGEVRTFRLDRISAPTARQGTFDVPADFDAGTYVTTGLARTPWLHDVSLLVRDTARHIRTRFPAGIATVQELPDGAVPTVHSIEPGAAKDETSWVRVQLRAERLDWIAPLLASLDRPYVIEQPVELRDFLHALAARIDRWATAAPPMST